ncbi:Ig-like domain-containing protein, partial [Escherichia coli]|uniref:Ig-like domain-containing protein n=1 Tax=Escherichia coli TaxID=562 RepID=UPI00311B1220
MSKNNSPADNTTANELTATVVDGSGNAAANVTVNWSVTSGNGVLTEGTSVTDDEGKAVMTLKDTTAETVKVLAHVGANAEDSGMDAETTFTLYPVVKVTPV